MKAALLAISRSVTLPPDCGGSHARASRWRRYAERLIRQIGKAPFQRKKAWRPGSGGNRGREPKRRNRPS